jgi:hypothetical protein
MIIGMSHAWFKNKNVGQQEIRAFIEKMKNLFPEEDLDEALLFRQLESIHSVRIGEANTLDDKKDHVEWFNPSTGKGLKREIEWHFWSHYSDYLSVRKGWPKNLVLSIDSLSNQIFSRLEDPQRPGRWDRRGMVMGSVQSGKTANYTALITKAADAGYKLVVVLAGVHDSLRSQTQTRLNEEFLGYDIDRVRKLTGGERRIGVREMFPTHNPVYTLTSSNQKGDFSKLVASQSGIFPSIESPPIILVIKKNVSILRNLITWIPSVISQTDADGHKFITDIPLLLIDDECDFASINTKEPEKDENGKIVEEWDPTAINRLIRQLLHLFEKCSYVGYTATPYANVFIHIDDTHPRYGEDLFPRSFIISLPQPSSYMGPEKIFGYEETPDEIEASEPLPLVRLVDDQSKHIPEGHDKELLVEDLPDSLKKALKCFLLTCAARQLRSEGVPHNSMLVHVTRFTAVQQQIKVLIDKELNGMASRIMSRDALVDFRDIWENDFVPTSKEMIKRGYRDSSTHSWSEIERSLGRIARVLNVRLINGTVRDALDYKDAEIAANNRKRNGEEVPWEEMGLSTVVIGGDKLSRGLTLEGLTISYYLRASTLYDTLMQMGRWFGYRGGYADLCRIFTTEELVSSYRHIALATRELREDIEYMSELKLTPSEFGLKVLSHPGRLAVTSLGKSRNKQEISLSYEGRISETVAFDPRYSRNNVKAMERLVASIGRKPDFPQDAKKRYHWKGVPPETVLAFLSSYKTHAVGTRLVDPKAIARYIEKQNLQGELITWNVVVVSKEAAGSSDSDTTIRSILIGGYEVRCVTRKALKAGSDKISIRRLVSPADEALDLTSEEIDKARNIDAVRMNRLASDIDLPSGPAIRQARSKERALLLIYVLAGEDDAKNTYGDEGHEIVGFAVSFPRSLTAEPIQYWVNPVYQEEEQHYT